MNPTAKAYEAREAVRAGADLIVVSHVLFNTGQLLPELKALVAAAHAQGARVLLDVYHSLGVLPVDVAALDVDFAVGGSYKYLRGGPGACYLYIHPRHLDVERDDVRIERLDGRAGLESVRCLSNDFDRWILAQR